MGAPVADVIDALSSGADTIGVTDEDGKEVGSISSQQIVDALQSKTSKDAE